jgi:hypothetical protein
LLNEGLKGCPNQLKAPPQRPPLKQKQNTVLLSRKLPRMNGIFTSEQSYLAVIRYKSMRMAKKTEKVQVQRDTTAPCKTTCNLANSTLT